MSNEDWTYWKTVAETWQAALTGVGIVVAGWWTYRLFIRQRQQFPRVRLAHDYSVLHLPDGRSLLRVKAKIENCGDVLIEIRKARTRVQQLLPLPPHVEALLKQSHDPPEDGVEFPWTVLASRSWRIDEDLAHVEPGESEVLESDFILAADIDAVTIYSYVENAAKSTQIGWSDSTIVRLKEPAAMSDPNRPTGESEKPVERIIERVIEKIKDRSSESIDLNEIYDRQMPERPDPPKSPDDSD